MSTSGRIGVSTVSASPLAVGRNRIRGSSRGARPRTNSSSAGLSGSIVKPPPAEALDAPRRPVERRHRLGKPAQRVRAEPADHGALAPRACEDPVDAVGLPRPEQADDTPAADVDQVLRDEMARKVPLDRVPGL